MQSKVHHVGYAVPNLERAVTEFEALGWSVCSDVTDDAQRKVRILFLQSGSQVIELVAPLTDDSPIRKTIQKGVGTPYHVCYEVESLVAAEAELKPRGFIVFKSAAPAPAINGQKVEFLFNRNIGIIELVEKSGKD